MKRYFNASEPLYENWTSICVESTYDKKRGGYVISVFPEKIEKKYGAVMCERDFSIGYYNTIGDLNVLVAPCGRRGAKKEAIAEKEVEENAEKYVKKFLELNGKENATYKEYSVV